MPLLPRRRTPTPVVQPPSRPVGSSGRGHMRGFLKYEERNPNLIGRAGLRQFEDMWRTDADCRKAIQMIVNPIAGATWGMEPYGGEDADEQARQISDFVWWALTKVMRPRLPSHIHEALRVTFRSGFAPFEQLWGDEQYEGRTVLVPKKLDLRLPRTIVRWEIEAGELQAIVQQPDSGPTATMDAGALVYYRVGAEGDNYEGESLLRPAFKHWLYKSQLEQIDVIAHERFAIGIPIGSLPRGATSGPERDALDDFLKGLRANEQAFASFTGPPAQYAKDGDGWHVEILTPNRSESGASELLSSIQHHAGKISAAVIEEFMRLGQENVGARATADVQQEPFLAFAEALAGVVVEDTLNEQLIRRIVDVNFGPVDGYPELSCSLIDSTSLTELGQYVATLVEKNALTPDDTLEEYLRSRADLPPVDASTQRQPPPPPQIVPGAQPPPPDGKPPVEPQLSRQARPLRPFEELMQLDRIEASLDGARERFERAGSAHVVQLAEQIAAGRAPTAAQAELEAALASELRALYLTGRDTVAQELHAQANPDLQLATPDPNDPSETATRNLAQRAKLAADQVLAAISGAIGHLTVSRARSGPAEKRMAGEQAGRAALRSEAQMHSGFAVNEGRSDEADDRAEEIRGSIYTSILDGARCPACATADDDTVRKLSDPVRQARRPPNAQCLGGSRCRCLEFFVLTDELTPAA